MGLERTNVVVAGGAIGGMTAALLLARAGASVTLLERVAEPADVGAGILLQTNGLAVLYGLGLREQLASAAYRHGDGGAVHNAAGTPIVGMPIQRYAHGLDHVLAVRRSHLYRVLHDAVAAERGIDARFGTTVTGATPAGTVTYTWEGRSGAFAADLVIGADGVSSTVRSGGNLGAVVRRTGTTYLRTLVHGEDLFAPGEYWTTLGLAGGASVGDGHTYLYASASAPPVAEALARKDLAALRQHWATALPLAATAFARIGRLDDVLVNEVLRVDCERWVDGRLTILGDAAHAMAPNLGQGANSALVDAAVLTAELATARPLETALRRFANRRQPAVRWVQDASDRVARLSETLSRIPNPVLRRVRDMSLRAVQRWAVTAKTHTQMQQEHPAELYETVAALAGRRQG